MSEATTIQIHKDTRDELRSIGRKGETYDELIHRLVEVARRVKFFEEIDHIIETEEFVSIDEI